MSLWIISWWVSYPLSLRKNSDVSIRHLCKFVLICREPGGENRDTKIYVSEGGEDRGETIVHYRIKNLSTDNSSQTLTQEIWNLDSGHSTVMNINRYRIESYWQSSGDHQELGLVLFLQMILTILRRDLNNLHFDFRFLSSVTPPKFRLVPRLHTYSQ